MENIRKTTLEMHTLLLCADVQFLGTTRGVLNQLHVTPKMVGASDDALALMQSQEFDVIIVDWREIDSLGEFVSAVRRGLCAGGDCARLAGHVASLRGRRTFSDSQARVGGVDRTLPACGVLRDRGAAAQATPGASQHCGCDQHTRLSVCRDDGGESERGGAGLRMAFDAELGAHLSVADEVELRFTLPGTDDMLQFSGTVVWTTSAHCGVKFGHIPDAKRLMLEQWLTVCVERSLAEVCGRLRAVCA